MSVPGGRIVADVAGAGSVVVLLHAGVADRRMWTAVWPELTAHHTVVRFDLRGFGESPVPAAPYRTVDDVLAVVEAVAGAGSVHLVGASHGGHVAMAFALTFPERVASLALLATGLSGITDPSPALQAYSDAEDRLYEAGDVAGAVDNDLAMWVKGPYRDWTPVTRAVAEQLRPQAEVAVRNQLALGADDPELPLADPPVRGRLADITAPTLVAVADHDPVDLVAVSELVAGAVPGARLVHVTAGHLIAMEQPAATAELLLRWLADQG